jgi:3-oxoacyl-[acyl-carrier protein] reductase
MGKENVQLDLGICGKRALITGAGRGLGQDMARSLAREGAKVAIVSRTESELAALLEEMGGESAGHYAIAKDMTLENAPQEVFRELNERFGPVDIAVQNMGGTMDINDPFCPVSDWRKLWRFNIEVAVELNLLLLPRMREQKWGRIVHISSIAAMENHGPVPYCALKSALTAYTRSMGRVLAPEGIVMTAVLPGAVFTKDGYWDVASKERPEHVAKYLDERMAIKRFGRLEEISSVVAFLCSEHASFCIGSIVPVDGGQGRSFFGE